jgi:hypothetical protein
LGSTHEKKLVSFQQTMAAAVSTDVVIQSKLEELISYSKSLHPLAVMFHEMVTNRQVSQYSTQELIQIMKSFRMMILGRFGTPERPNGTSTLLFT